MTLKIQCNCTFFWRRPLAWPCACDVHFKYNICLILLHSLSCRTGSKAPPCLKVHCSTNVDDAQKEEEVVVEEEEEEEEEGPTVHVQTKRAKSDAERSEPLDWHRPKVKKCKSTSNFRLPSRNSLLM